MVVNEFKVCNFSPYFAPVSSRLHGNLARISEEPASLLWLSAWNEGCKVVMEIDRKLVSY